MLVCDQNGVELFCVLANRAEPGKNVALAETGVDKDTRFFGSDEGRVSRAAAGENANVNDGVPPRGYSSVSGSRWMLCSPAVFFSQYLRSQASQLLPAAVSRPVNARAWMSE
jgi:hypothetical protein